MRPPPLLLTALATLAAGLSSGCGDPVRDQQIAALGEEVPGVEPGPFHRAGQPCLACHGPYGGVEPELSIGGTIYFIPQDGEPYPVEGVTVRIRDSEGRAVEKTTNCIGNFFWTREELDPAFPLRAELLETAADGEVLVRSALMTTRIARDGSCAGCHTHPRSPTSPGLVYVPGSEGKYPRPTAATCEGVP